ncbi:MAG: EAL domain-containing protein [Candidatus Accumulibacter sp.]|jgi:diguanylate cyclase (GGDEF)-like protein|uniref:bifunctional diguanylate cyclase/phosphodiesterase n=1 Tax=Accumulibacter sp. TaxID=2053492 RepID=UPI002590A4C1|nr:EAL domain-containing protein [Accumulibacter sp.]MBK8115250.1 EAL domain-containing protein [Accumulibacter sp.]
MSMYRQFWLALFTSMLLAFGGSLIASLLSARAYLESQLSIKNADNASALALSLSLSNPEPATIELTTTALFDSGHYELIRVVDPEGNQIVERVGVVDDRDAPQWFMRWLPIHATPGQAKINNEVQQVGTVTVVSHNHFAYAMLWGSVWPTIAAMTFACLVGGSLGAIILGRLKAPLQAVIDQATAITERRFVTIDEPAVPELKHLALAMNATIRRLRTMFQDEAARLETLRREANFDPLTGLANRNHFMARLRQALDAEDAGEGTLLLIRLADLAGVNRRLGRDTTDEFLRCAGEVIAECPAVGSQGLAARLNGADFAILLTGESDAQATASGLLAALIEAGRPFVNDRAVAWIAIGRFGQGTDIAALLARVDRALATAEVEGGNSIYEAVVDVASPLPRNADQWSQVITRALDGQGLRLGSFPVLDTCGRLSHRESPLRLLTTENGEWLTAGSFLPIAERLKLTPALDLAAVTLGLQDLRSEPELAGLAINISASSVANASFRERLLHLLGVHAEESSRLWLEISESGALRHLAAFRELCLALRASNCRIGLEHFGHQFSQIGVLHDLGLDYLKVDASFVRGIDSNRGNAAFLKGLTGIAHSIGLQVLAEGVATEQEWLILMELGFDGATGPAISVLAAKANHV